MANRRRVMWDAAHANNISTLKLFRAASTILTDLEEKKVNIFKEALEKAGATAKVEPTKD